MFGRHGLATRVMLMSASAIGRAALRRASRKRAVLFDQSCAGTCRSATLVRDSVLEYGALREANRVEEILDPFGASVADGEQQAIQGVGRHGQPAGNRCHLSLRGSKVPV